MSLILPPRAEQHEKLIRRSRARGALGAVVASVRSLVGSTGQWPRVRERFLEKRPDGEDAIDAAGRWGIVEIDIHVALLSSAYEVLGEEPLRELGRRRMAGEVELGMFATIARSWLRAFASEPVQFLRVAPYLWRIALHGCGRLQLIDSGDDFARFRVQNAPQQLLDSHPWQVFLEGLGQGLLDIMELEGEVRFGPPCGTPDAVDFIGRWKSRDAH